LEEFISHADFSGSLCLSEFNLRAHEGADNERHLYWAAFSAFYLADYDKALECFSELVSHYDFAERTNRAIFLSIATCLFFKGEYERAEEEALKGPDARLRNRILFHIAHKTNDRQKLMACHNKLSQDCKEDQLALASVHFQGGHYQEAIDIYKRLLLENREDLALNVYVAMCYYKLDYYDVSLEILAVYLQAYPHSAFALNLKACNQFKLYNGKAAENEVTALSDSGFNVFMHDLLRHNLVVFTEGDNALQTLPRLVDAIPEARLNLILYYLKHDSLQEAYDLSKDLEPSSPQEYIIKAIVSATVGQATGSRDHVKLAQQYFQIVGSSHTECDTIPGRQCMASCFFLLKLFEDVNIYLSSIKAYLYSDDAFNWNYGISLASTGDFRAAEETLHLVHAEKLRADFTYLSWLCRCYIMNGNPRSAWELHLTTETTADSFSLLQLIAHDCYKMGHFLFAAKAFDALEAMDPDPEYSEGKRGAVVGVFQQVVAGKETSDALSDAVRMIRDPPNPQLTYIVRTIEKWCRENRIPLV
jgi:intraflagellar transport protein 56